MADFLSGFPHLAEAGGLSAAASGLAAATSVNFALIQSRFQQLSADAASMWAVALTSPTVSSAMGFKTASESGSGRTRVEANTPASGQVVGPQ